VGSVLAELVASGEVQRNEIIVVSKIGYIQGQNLKIAEAKERTGHPYPDMVKYGDGIWHCIHPEFLADQLTSSLDRLGLTTLDICLLHNPEYFLLEARHRSVADIQKLRTEFYDRLQRAFAYFETQVAAGRLQYYGVSSNTIASSADDPEGTSLSLMVQAAEKATLSRSISPPLSGRTVPDESFRIRARHTSQYRPIMRPDRSCLCPSAQHCRAGESAAERHGGTKQDDPTRGTSR
jgi:aryl-alcohol dehydrogenase-like predicted oxidoreductase